MEIKKLFESNPWWATKAVPIELKGKYREEYKLLVESVKIKEITILTGVRRSGKSTLMYQMVDVLLSKGIKDKSILPEQILFVNLEDSKLLNDSLDDIYQSYREEINPDKKAYVFLDEIHKRPKWEQWIRRLYDLHANCKFIISGSCSYLLKKEYSTLLTGRNLTFEVFPLSFTEYISFKGVAVNSGNIIAFKKGIFLDKDKFVLIKSLKEYLEYGGFPDIFFKEKDFKTKVLAQYFDDILYKDIVDRYNTNSQKTKDLALYFITNFTSLISLRNLRASLGLSYESIKDYLSYFKEAFLFFTIEPFSYSVKEQKTGPSKIYCIDNGLRNAVSFKFSKDEGKLAENLVFLELKRKGLDIYYWKGKQEVDFVVKQKDNTLTAINVSHTDNIDEREISSLLEFKKEFKNPKTLVILTKNIEKKEKGVNFIPLWKWLMIH